jgi:hypothetical protein
MDKPTVREILVTLLRLYKDDIERKINEEFYENRLEVTEKQINAIFSPMTEAQLDEVLPKKRKDIKHYLCESGNCTGCWEEEINNTIDDCKQALLKKED